MTSHNDVLLSDLRRMQRLYSRNSLPDKVVEYISERYIPIGGENGTQYPSKKFAKITWEIVRDVIVMHYRIDWDRLRAKGRKKTIVDARSVMMYLMWFKCKMTLTAIGEVFGMHHTSILHCRDMVADKIATHRDVRKEVEYLNEQIKLSAKISASQKHAS